MSIDNTEKNAAEIVNVNTTIFLTFTLLFILCRSYTSSTGTLGFLKGRLNSFCGMLLKISILSAVVYNLIFNYLSTKFDINKVELEIKESLDYVHKINFQDYSIDAINLMIYSLKISQFLFISCVFLGIALLVPDSVENSEEAPFDPATIKYNSRISSLCKLWAVFRIPIVFYSSYLNPYLNEKITLFIILVFSNVEISLAALFLLLIKFKNNSAEQKNQTDVGLFSIVLMSYGLIRYGINLIDLPFKLSILNLNIITSVQSAFMISLYMLLTDIIFPRVQIKVQETINLSNEQFRIPKNDVQLLETLVVFDDQKVK